MSETPDVAEVIDAIIDGRYDADLADVFTACVTRNDERSHTMTWGLRVPHPSRDGEELVATEHDLTLDEWGTAEELARKTWVTLDPRQSSQSMRAILTAVYQHRAGLSRGEAVAAVGSVSGSVLLDCLEYVEVPRRPLSAGR